MYFRMHTSYFLFASLDIVLPSRSPPRHKFESMNTEEVAAPAKGSEGGCSISAHILRYLLGCLIPLFAGTVELKAGHDARDFAHLRRDYGYGVELLGA